LISSYKRVNRPEELSSISTDGMSSPASTVANCRASATSDDSFD
jgi:hypothetical protein